MNHSLGMNGNDVFARASLGSCPGIVGRILLLRALLGMGI